MERFTQQEAQAMVAEITPRLPTGWEVAGTRRLWLSDEWTIDLMSEERGWFVRSREDWKDFLDKYDMLPCRECGHVFHRNIFECEQCGATRF